MAKTASAETASEDFDLDASDEELLEEFGLLMAAEYYYATKNISALQEGGADKIDGLLKFSISRFALRVSSEALEKRFEAAVATERRLRQ